MFTELSNLFLNESTFTPDFNVITTIENEFADVELKVSISVFKLLICSSTGVVISFATVSADAPGYTVWTVRIPRVAFGNPVVLSARVANNPAKIRIIKAQPISVAPKKLSNVEIKIFHMNYYLLFNLFIECRLLYMKFQNYSINTC